MAKKSTKLKSPKKFLHWGAVVAIGLAAMWSVARPQPRALASAVPKLSISNGSVVEGDSGVSQLHFKLTLSAAVSSKVTVQYTTADLFGSTSTTDDYGSAKGSFSTAPGSGDYMAVTGQTVTFLAGQVVQTITIDVIGDTTLESDELMTVNLSNPVGATIIDGSGTGTIINDDATTGFRLGIGDASIRNGLSKNRTVDLPIQFSAPAPVAFKMTAQTISGTATGVPNATTAGGDFISKKQIFSVAAGVTSKSFTITILPDAVIDGTENFTVNLTSTYGSVIRSIGNVEIRDGLVTFVRAGRRPGPPRIALMGDSVTANYQERAKQLFETRGFQVYKHGLPGAGLQDAAWCQGQYANSVMTADDPDYVVFESMGNYGWFAKCDASIVYDSPQFYGAWEAVAQQYAATLTSAGAKLFWVLAPSVPIQDRHDAIATFNPFYTQLATTTTNMSTIDAWTPFGGDPPNCSLRDIGISPGSYCLHMNAAGEILLANTVNANVN